MSASGDELQRKSAWRTDEIHGSAIVHDRAQVSHFLLIQPPGPDAYLGNMRTICLALVLAAASTARADSYSINGRLGDVYTDLPVPSADVFITGPHGLERTVATDDAGHYLAPVDGPGDYILTFALGPQRIGYKVAIAAPGSTHFDAKIDRGEVIEIHDLPAHRPPIMPSPIHRLPKIPAYSDNMIETDSWAKAWLLLDIDEHGAVARAKLLNHPGHDLDQIAIDHALGLTFNPAYDNLGHPMRTLIIYPIEWPSYWWMIDLHGGFALRMPEPQFVQRVPCEGSGPLHMGSMHPVYRTCSRPDLSHVEQEPWHVAKR
jgi:hypothetical protein